MVCTPRDRVSHARLTRKLRAADRARYSTLRTMLRLPLADRECILHAAIAYLRAPTDREGVSRAVLQYLLDEAAE